MKDSKVSNSFSKDKSTLFLSTLLIVVSILNSFIVLIKLRISDFKVPTQYVVDDGSILQTSNWYSLYSFAVFSILSAGSALFLASRFHKSSRGFSVSVLIIAVVIQLITLLVSSALLGLVGKV